MFIVWMIDLLYWWIRVLLN